MTTGLPFDDIRDLVQRLPAGDEAAAAQVHAQFERSGRAGGSLGQIEETAAWLSRWTGRPPAVRRPLVALFAGTHGIARHGVSRHAGTSTERLVELCAAGGAAINQICLAHELGLKVFDLALHLPTGDITAEPALDERGCAATMAFGMEAAGGGTDLLCVGAIGVGGSTVAAAMFAALYGGTGTDWTEVGRNATDPIAIRSAAAVEAALATHRAHLGDPLEILRRLGGREFAAIAGAIIAARMEKVPVLLDGHAAIAAAAVLQALRSDAVAHCLVAQKPVPAGLAVAAQRLGLGQPLLDLAITHGQGMGAGLAAGIVKAAALVSTGMAAAL